MKSEDGSIAVLERALDQTGRIVAGVRPDQLGLATPCTEWDVRALTNHIVVDLLQFTASVRGDAWERPTAEVIGDDPAGDYRRAAAGLLAAWRDEGALDRKIELPGGAQVPAEWRLGQHVADVVVHGWDLASALGVQTELDPELARFSLDWGRENLRPEFRGRAFGPEVTAAEDAPLYERLAAFFGREPR